MASCRRSWHNLFFSFVFASITFQLFAEKMTPLWNWTLRDSSFSFFVVEIFLVPSVFFTFYFYLSSSSVLFFFRQRCVLGTPYRRFRFDSGAHTLWKLVILTVIVLLTFLDYLITFSRRACRQSIRRAALVEFPGKEVKARITPVLPRPKQAFTNLNTAAY